MGKKEEDYISGPWLCAGTACRHQFNKHVVEESGAWRCKVCKATCITVALLRQPYVPPPKEENIFPVRAELLRQ